MKRTQISTNVSELTRAQVDELMDKLGFSLRDVVTIAIDRLYKQEMTKLATIGYDVIVNGKHITTYHLRHHAEARAQIEKRTNPEAEIEVVEKELPDYFRWKVRIAESGDPEVVILLGSKPSSVK